MYLQNSHWATFCLCTMAPCLLNISQVYVVVMMLPSLAINLNCKVHVYLIIFRKSVTPIYIFYPSCSFKDLLILATYPMPSQCFNICKKKIKQHYEMSEIRSQNANKDIVPLNWYSKPKIFFIFDSAVNWSHHI